MADYTKTYTLDFTATGDTVYGACDKLEDNEDDIIGWINNLKDCYAGTTAPSSPAPSEGQLWYQTNTDILWVYDGTNWHAVNVIVAASDPTGEREGDLWYESDTEILRVSDGTNWHIVNVAVGSSVPTTPTPQNGDMFLITTDGTLYVYYSSAWHSIAFQRTRNIMLLPDQGWPSSTSGCAAVAQVESSTNKVNYKTMDFSHTADENAEWTVILPDDYNAGTMTAIFTWTTADGASEEGVCWSIQARAYANDDAIDQAYGTAVTATDVWIANDDIHITGSTAAMTIAGGPVAGELCQFRVYRDVSDDVDTIDADCKLLGVKLSYSSVGT